MTEIIDQLPDFFIRITPVMRPPIAECVTRGKRNLTGKQGKIFQGSFVIISISHKIPILSLPSLSFLDPGPIGIIK